jgi:hypothetical protein
MRMKITFQLFILTFLMFSCSKVSMKIDVSYDPETQKGILLVDGEKSFKLSADSATTQIRITEGNHTFKLNKEKEFTQYIPREGGILNLNNESFVTIIQPYGTEEKNPYALNSDLMMVNQDFVVVDSMIYYYKKDSLQEVSDSQLKRAIAMDKNQRGAGSMKYFEAKKFINKDWDFGLNEDFPETIEERTTNSGVSFGSNLAYRSKVVDFTLFKLYAMMNPQYFVIRSIKDIEASKVDKKEDSKKESKQMKFE